MLHAWFQLRSQLESDLLDAQSRIEDLDKLVQVKGQDTGWIKEKEEINKEIRLLKEKSTELEDTEHKLKLQLSEMEEENEVMEFRVLELEDANEKLLEETRYTVTFTLPPAVTEGGMLQIYAEEKGIMKIGAAELQEHLEQLRTSQDLRLNTEEKVALVQAAAMLNVTDKAAMLNVTDKKFKELQNTHTALWERIHQLEEEKARLVSDATGVSAEVVLEYESVNNQLIAAQLQISELQQELENYKKEKAVFEYTNAIYRDTENRYKCDISSLQRQLSTSHEGRDYETEIIAQRLDQLKELEQDLAVDSSLSCLAEDLAVDCSLNCMAEDLAVDSSLSCKAEGLAVESSLSCLAEDLAVDSSLSCLAEDLAVDSSLSCLAEDLDVDSSLNCKAEDLAVDSSLSFLRLRTWV
ncbi:hypothetical protein LSAT2_032876 [Lamellibrachia satsuma]|nr:hypothetical protein LSAT2_032876 [Lamellibrachia satsuma]